jgi:endonuclease/exonuclease/phosphatase family metal-dependent hydrolase
VKGLPWPIALDRSNALAEIAAQLRTLKSEHKAPQIVVLQETFTAEARSLGPAAGYRYIATGPAEDEPANAQMTALDRRFESQARWWKGETEGKYVGSGLQILSDYPIIATRHVAFPAFACAGFDCLANKGALLVTIDIPGGGPIDIVTTHLNSRRASGVEDARSIFAYRRQVGVLTDFIKRYHDPRYPLVAAGDFNVGSALPRRLALLDDVHGKWAGGEQVRDALNQAVNDRYTLGRDARYSLKRARDWQFYADGSNAALTLTNVDVPLGRDKNGAMLSDHVGYVAHFHLEPSPGQQGVIAQATNGGRSKA